METQVQEGLYIYCIIKSAEPQSFGALGIGDRGDELYCVGADLPAVPEAQPMPNATHPPATLARSDCGLGSVAGGPAGLPADLSAVLPTPAVAGFAKAGALGAKVEATSIARAKEGGLCAVVSRSPMKKFKMSRDNLLAHERAIEEVMKAYTVLPVRFATVAENDEKVCRILKKETERFSTLLCEMEGRKELGVKAIFNSEKIYAQIAEQKEIKETRARLSSLPADRIYFQKMELGRLVEKALEREREKCRAEIMDTLEPLAIEVKTTKPYGEMMILNAAFLVERAREQEFDAAVRRLDERFGALITWHYIGTLPPFNFVNVEISTEDL